MSVKIYIEITCINTIADLECVVLNNLRTFQRISRVCNIACLKPMFKTLLRSSGILLFQSSYTKGKTELELPLKEDNKDYGKRSCRGLTGWWQNMLRSWLDHNECNGLLSDARKILEKKKSSSNFEWSISNQS